jgi:pyrroloquinoline quinone biosynthesis protein B
MHLQLIQAFNIPLRYHMKFFLISVLIIILTCCNNRTSREETGNSANATELITPYIFVLGTIQDAGSPHIACNRECCINLFSHPDPRRKVVSLGLIDPVSKKKYLFEATPDMPSQMKALKGAHPAGAKEVPDGVFLTHAHIGHYTGLMYLGREAMNADQLPVYVMPAMKLFLEQNGPWSQLVELRNINLQAMADQTPVSLSPFVTVTPFLVPHRDEYSETVGYHIAGPNKSLLFIPDIDKWHQWETSILEEIEKVDYALIDGSFFDGKELDYRNMDDIPHPSISESMETFKSLSRDQKNKIYFIHFNHTNPVILENSEASRMIENSGFHVARYHQRLFL